MGPYQKKEEEGKGIQELIDFSKTFLTFYQVIHLGTKKLKDTARGWGRSGLAVVHLEMI